MQRRSQSVIPDVHDHGLTNCRGPKRHAPREKDAVRGVEQKSEVFLPQIELLEQSLVLRAFPRSFDGMDHILPARMDVAHQQDRSVVFTQSKPPPVIPRRKD